MAAATMNGMVKEEVLEKKKIVPPLVWDYFRNLGDKNESVRIRMGFKLLLHLTSQQRTYKINQAEKGDNGPLCSQVQYSLERLVRGLASSRECARQGFFTVLVELLRVVPEIDLGHIQAALEQAQQNDSGASISKSETGDALVRQVMTFGAFFRTDRIHNISPEEMSGVVETLMTAAPQRTYVETLVYGFLIHVAEKMEKKPFARTIWPLLSPTLVLDWDQQSLDKLWLIITLRERFPSLVKKKLSLPAFGVDDPLDQSQFTSLGQLLLTVPVLSVALKHPVYNVLLEQLSQNDLQGSFWLQGIEAQLEHPTPARILLTFHIAGILIPHLSQPQVIFTPKFVRMLTIALSRKNNEVQLKAAEFLGLLVKKIGSEEISVEEQLAVMQKLLKPSGILMFDRATDSRAVSQLSLVLKPKAVLWLSNFYQNIVLGKKEKDETGEESWQPRERIHAMQALAKLLAHPQMKSEISWKQGHLRVLLLQAFFKTQTASLGKFAQECFFRALDIRYQRVEEMSALLWPLVKEARQLIHDTQESQLLQEMEPEVREEWDRMWQAALKLKKKLKKSVATEEHWEDHIIMALFLLMGLHLLIEPKMATEILQELHGCLGKLDGKKKENSDPEEVEEEEPQWVEVVTELLLSLLSWNKHLLRNIACSIFTLLCPHLTSNALGQILEVVNPQAESNRLRNLGEDDEEEESEEETTKVEEEEESEQSDSEEEESEEDDGTIPVNNELRSKVQAALGDMMAVSDEESVDMDTMDDVAMERMDKALAEIFCSIGGSSQEKKGRKKTQSKQDTALMHFRTRALDLLEIFLQQQQPPLKLVLQTILPLLSALEYSVREKHQGPFGIRVRVCFKKLAHCKKFVNVEGVMPEQLEEMFNAVLEKGKQMSVLMADVGDELAHSCTLVIRASILFPSPLTAGFLSSYESSLSRFLYDRDCVLPLNLFSHSLQLSWPQAWDLGKSLLKAAFGSEARLFRRTQALQLLCMLMQNRPLVVKDCGEAARALGVQVIEETRKFLSNATESAEVAVKPKFLQTLFHTLNMLYNLDIWLSQKEDVVGTALQWDEFKTALVDFGKNVAMGKHQDLKREYNKMISHLKIQVVRAQQQQKVQIKDEEDTEELQNKGKKKKKKGAQVAENSQESSEGKDGKKKKKQRTKEEQEARKKAKRRRMEAFSEGLESSGFSGLVEEEVKDYDSNDEEEAVTPVPENHVGKIKNKRKKRN